MRWRTRLGAWETMSADAVVGGIGPATVRLRSAGQVAVYVVSDDDRVLAAVGVGELEIELTGDGPWELDIDAQEAVFLFRDERVQTVEPGERVLTLVETRPEKSQLQLMLEQLQRENRALAESVRRGEQRSRAELRALQQQVEQRRLQDAGTQESEADADDVGGGGEAEDAAELAG